MTRQPIHPSYRGDDAFDLSGIFIGREQQLDLFNIYLTRWQTLISAITPAEPPIMDPPSPDNRIQGLLILLYGRGGFGKSTLLQRYHTIAAEANAAPFASKLHSSKIINWEFAVEGRRSLFNLSPGKEIDASAYFKLLCPKLALALDKNIGDFKNYQRAGQDVEQATKEALRLIESLQSDKQLAPLRQLAGAGLITLLRLVPVVGAPLKDDQIAEKVKELAGTGAAITAEQIVQLHAKLQDRLGHKLGDYLQPEQKLGLNMGRDLRDFARNYPLLIFFDTYEEIDEGDNLLRMVMGAAGTRVGWVMASRDNLWAGLNQRLRSVGIEYGYKDITLPDRALPIDFSTSGAGAFTASDIKDYFDELCRRAPYHPPLQRIPASEAERIWNVTLGIPLAIKIAAGLYVKTENVADITEDIEGKLDTIDQMVRRFLLHVRKDQEDQAKLYGLALLRRPDQPHAVSAALNLTTEEARTSYRAALSHLHRRYSFIFTEKDEPALHQEVRHFLRLWLLAHRANPEIIDVNEQLKDAQETALKKLENQRQYFSLQDRLQDDQWVGIYLDLTEQQYWLDPVEGVKLLLPFMLAAAIYQRPLNKDAVKIGSFFASHISEPYRRWWQWAEQSLIYTSSRNPSSAELAGLQELEKLLKQQRSIFAQPLAAYRNELEAALWWRLGEAYLGKDDTKALDWYKQALSLLDQETELKTAAAEACWNIADKLYEQKKYQESLPFWDQAIGLDPTLATAYSNRGNAYDDLKQYEQAIEDYTRAIELDPTLARAYSNRGVAYANLKQYEQAIEDYTHAIELDPTDATAYYNRGNAYDDLKQYEQAIEDYTRAIELDPTDARAYSNRGVAYANLKQYEQAIEDYTHAIELDPTLATAYYNRGVANLKLKNVIQAQDDYSRASQLDGTDINAAWMAEWAGMGKQRGDGGKMAERLENIAKIDEQKYVAHVCRGVASALRGKLKEGLAEIEKAIPLNPEEWDAYFWKGMLCAYYYQAQTHDKAKRAIEALEQALAVRLPPILLTPLYWLESDRPEFFTRYAKPLLDRYGI